ncbi:MAG TPA: carboxylesterase family protein, partial [Puia sp.]|nr:carboxylesterase family protein [Puia sp.]
LEDEEKAGVDLQEKLGVKSIAEMRALPADSIIKVAHTMGNLRFAPIRDGSFLPVDLDKSFIEGKFNQVDFLGGWVTGDGAVLGNTKTTPEEFIKKINESYGKKAAKLLTLLPHGNAEEASASLMKMNLINFGVLSPYRLSKYNSKRAYIYEFSHVPAAKPNFPDYGAFHTSEVPYALHTLHLWDRPWQHSDILLEEDMSKYWINFIRSGNPNGPSLPDWKTYHSGFSLEFGDSVQGKSNLYKDILEVLSSE